MAGLFRETRQRGARLDAQIPGAAVGGGGVQCVGSECASKCADVW